MISVQDQYISRLSDVTVFGGPVHEYRGVVLQLFRAVSNLHKTVTRPDTDILAFY